MRKNIFVAGGLALLYAAAFVPQAAGQEKMDAESRAFLSEIRYIITNQERKIFAELPAAARPQFIEDFWKRRDPNPETEFNEFREAYYRRIEEANRLFRGTPRGWLQDRGRYYILFGPPDERRTNPMGGRHIDATGDHRELTGGTIAATGEKATEVWTYYNLFSSLQKPQVVQLVFVDSDGTGVFRLATNLEQLIPGGIDSLLGPDLEFTHEVYKEEHFSSRPRQRSFFDFDWEFLKQEDPSSDSNLTVQVALPYRRLLFQADGDRIRAVLRLDIEVRDRSGKALWASRREDTLALDRRTVEENPNAPWKLSVPVARRLAKGRYQIFLRLENVGGGQSVDKLLFFRM